MSPSKKGLRTALQSIIGVAVGLVVVVWAVPGVPEAVIQYLTDNAIQIALVVGIPSGLVAWLQNKLGV
jgi:precorrin isomerase